jgi:hypothetical protein
MVRSWLAAWKLADEAVRVLKLVLYQGTTLVGPSPASG